jgi:hypothetical protein
MGEPHSHVDSGDMVVARSDTLRTAKRDGTPETQRSSAEIPSWPEAVPDLLLWCVSEDCEGG